MWDFDSRNIDLNCVQLSVWFRNSLNINQKLLILSSCVLSRNEFGLVNQNLSHLNLIELDKFCLFTHLLFGNFNGSSDISIGFCCVCMKIWSTMFININEFHLHWMQKRRASPNFSIFTVYSGKPNERCFF